MKKKPLCLLILAAGKGKRMKSAVPKVLHTLLDRPMLAYVMDLARSIDAVRRAIVVGHGAQEVTSIIDRKQFEVIRQKQQLGTGHAVRQARSLLAGGADLLVLSGDTPLLTKKSVSRLLARHRRRKAAVTLLTGLLDDPTGYGRVLRGDGHAVRAIVEDADADAAVQRIREVNSGIYCFDTTFLNRAIGRLRRANRQSEYYLTDVVAAAVAEGLSVETAAAADPVEIVGVNSRLELAGAGDVLRLRKLERLMRSGVTVVDPATTWVDEAVRVGADTVLLPRTHLEGKTRIGRGSRIGPASRLRHSILGRGVIVRDCCVIENAKIGEGCQIGPFAHLRPGSELAAGVRVGNFVEVKGSRLGRGTKANHLSYIGDAEVGRGVNIGAGTITCNYDGTRKWRTVIEDGAFIGSDSQLVAPVRIGRDALVGAGSTITGDVPPGSLSLSRAPQEDRPGMARRYLKKKEKKT